MKESAKGGNRGCRLLLPFFALFVLTSGNLPAATVLDTSEPVSFFTNAVDRLLKRCTAEWQRDYPQHFYQMFGTNWAFGVNDIPVFVNGRFAYTPSVHRVLQLVANIWDAANPSNHLNAAYGPEPTIFRPIFKVVGTNVYIQDFIESPFLDTSGLTPQPLDLGFSNSLAFMRPNSLIFGVPFIVGARKGLPNFNEFAADSIVQITRKVELVKSGPGGSDRIIRTNQYFTIGISNAFGAEFWNSYATNFTRPVEIAVTNFCLVSLTNDFGFIHQTNLTAFGLVFTNQWSGWNGKFHSGASFLVPLRTNHIIIPDLVAAQDHLGFLNPNAPNLPTPTTPVPLALPRWGLTITNRVVACLKEPGVQGRLLDFALLGSMVAHREITAEMAQDRNAIGIGGIWATNSPDGIHLSGQFGVINQIQVSRGEIATGPNDWEQHGINQPSGATKDHEIARFLAFFAPNNVATYNGFTAVNTNLTAFASFTPTWKQSLPMLWQANDPLIHYTAGDMEFLERSMIPIQWNPPSRTNTSTLANLGRVNERYRPWGGNPFTTGGGSSIAADPNAYNYTLKDPLVRSSRDWDFPENEPLSLALLRRVHRGTPWQSIYLKADRVVTNAASLDNWRGWTGNRFLWSSNFGGLPVSDAEFTAPPHDWKLVSLIASLFSTNDPRTLLSINEPDTNRWLATLDGLVALTNSATEYMLQNGLTQFDPLIVTSNSAQAALIAESIQALRRAQPYQRFDDLDALFAVSALSDASPYLNHGTVDPWTGLNEQQMRGLSDEAYERLPVQLLPRLRPDSLGVILASADGWRLRFSGKDGFPYIIESTTNFLDWRAVATNLPVDGIIEMTLEAAGNQAFYRSRLAP